MDGSGYPKQLKGDEIPLGARIVAICSTGEIGIITNIRKNYGARPIVNVHYNSFYKPLSQPKVVDLGEQRTIFIEEILD